MRLMPLAGEPFIGKLALTYLTVMTFPVFRQALFWFFGFWRGDAGFLENGKDFFPAFTEIKFGILIQHDIASHSSSTILLPLLLPE